MAKATIDMERVKNLVDSADNETRSRDIPLLSISRITRNRFERWLGIAQEHPFPSNRNGIGSSFRYKGIAKAANCTECPLAEFLMSLPGVLYARVDNKYYIFFHKTRGLCQFRHNTFTRSFVRVVDSTFGHGCILDRTDIRTALERV